MSKKADSIVRIPCNDIKSFFYYWIMFLKPFHHLTDRESEVAIAFLKERYELSKVITDSAILDKVVFGDDTIAKIKEECSLSTPHLQTILNKLKQKKIIVDNRLNQRYIPNTDFENGMFKMMLLFEIQ